MNKKLFTSVVDELVRRTKDEMKIADVTRNYDYADVCLTGLSSEVIMLLEDTMRDVDYWITHWLYEVEVEEGEPLYFVDGEPFYVSNSEELYEFLIKNYNLKFD